MNHYWLFYQDGGTIRNLDFIIIGAQKSGTTTLFEILKEHPAIFIPPGKEVPFFSRNQFSPRKYSLFLDEHFSQAPIGNLLGKVTPHYLNDQQIGSRILKALPDIKIVVILRDPAERALSHYRMSVRRGLETRTFEHAINDMLKDKNLKLARKLPTGQVSENKTYVTWGEYGRLLEPYKAILTKGQLYTLFTSDLEHDPKGTMARLFSFLQVDNVENSSIGKKFHQGGEREKLPVLRYAKHISIAKFLWRRVPPRIRTTTLFKFNQWNIIKDEKNLSNYDPKTIALLRQHYQEALPNLSRLLQKSIPWEQQ